ncbi:MAG: exodeoxyribonuclease VII small subunit [Acidobacteriota bacterium]
MAKESNSFESSLEKLEEIVAKLHEGDRPLDESLKLFEDGIKLARECSERLDQAERKIEILTKDADGAMTPREMDADGDGQSGVGRRGTVSDS